MSKALKEGLGLMLACKKDDPADFSKRAFWSGRCRQVIASFLVSSLFSLIEACAPTLKGGPVPRGEPVTSETTEKTDRQELLTLSGIVIDKKGNPFPGVQVEAREPGSDRVMATALTDGSGRFRLNLPQGRYRIAAVLQGFSQATREIIFQPGMTLSLEINLGEPGDQIPRGEPLIPPTSTPSGGVQTESPCVVSVVEHSFADDATLHAWLNEQADLQRIVFAVIPEKDQTSLFFMKPGPKAFYTVIAVDGTPDPGKIQTCLNLNRKRSFMGIHLLSERFLIIFSNGR